MRLIQRGYNAQPLHQRLHQNILKLLNFCHVHTAKTFVMHDHRVRNLCNACILIERLLWEYSSDTL